MKDGGCLRLVNTRVKTFTGLRGNALGLTSLTLFRFCYDIGMNCVQYPPEWRMTGSRDICQTMHGKTAVCSFKPKSVPKTGLGRRVKVSPGQLTLFVEKNFDSRALLAGTYDFVTCQRSDGSYYGNGGTQCKKGSESSLPAKGVYY